MPGVRETKPLTLPKGTELWEGCRPESCRAISEGGLRCLEEEQGSRAGRGVDLEQRLIYLQRQNEVLFEYVG